MVASYLLQHVKHILYDFNDDSFDGQPIDNYKVVRSYIQDQVIEKGL
ncbi:MAG: hypothetical protein H6Q26_2057 [Bacteroidetes bacterium]|nr:hypothetical protein [Bacteroidota bacterium]